ncbi:MAG TPA: agmatinase [Steroidobacteraceae bacterium]|nr:agmatinase [Steroidobacteraceae bacterium]
MSEYLFAFQGSTTHGGFLRAPPLAARPDARFLVAGVPWDGATTNRPGARFGPQEIRRASHMLCDGIHPAYGLSPLEALADCGDLTLPNTALGPMRAALEPQARSLLAKHHMVWLGGDHSITLSLLRAYRAHVGRPLALLHFDAHCDTWESHFDEPSGHGTWVFEALREGLVDPRLSVQIGIRSAAAPATSNYVADRGGLIYTGRDLRGLASSAQLERVTTEVRARLAAHAAVPVYLSFDIDCLDPAYAPGTGTPEPGGLSTTQALTLLEDLDGLNFIGMDLCEVSPPYDHAELSSNAAATLVWTYLCGRVARAPRAA